MHPTDWQKAEYQNLVERSSAVLSFMRDIMDIPPVSIVQSPTLSQIMQRPVWLQMECLMPFGGSGKVRSIAGISCAIAAKGKQQFPQQVIERSLVFYQQIKDRLPQYTNALINRKASTFAALSLMLDGKTLVAASTGSHARAVLEWSHWLKRWQIAEVDMVLFISADCSSAKLDAFTCSGIQVVTGGNFTDITVTAQRYAKDRANHIFIPTDPEDQNSEFGLFNRKDGMAGFATGIIETLQHSVTQHSVTQPSLAAVYIPTSGGATWAACKAWLAGQPQLGIAYENLIGAADSSIMPVQQSLTRGIRQTNCHALTAAEPINGLFQKDMSPYAFDLMQGLVKQPDREIQGVEWPEVRIAQQLVLQDTGIIPEPAGASAVAAALIHFAQNNPARFMQSFQALSIDTLSNRDIEAIYTGYAAQITDRDTQQNSTNSAIVINISGAFQQQSAYRLRDITAYWAQHHHEHQLKPTVEQACYLARSWHFIRQHSDSKTVLAEVTKAHNSLSILSDYLQAAYDLTPQDNRNNFLALQFANQCMQAIDTIYHDQTA